jgi:phytoene dehydrogenase-like protein
VNPTNADVLVIGSGIGAMACAAYLAKLGNRRVRLLERHFKPGGQTHGFRRRGYSWDVGLHYVGGMGVGEPGRRLMDFITGGEVQWHPTPDPYDVLCFPKFRFEVPFGEGRYREQLAARFHGEARAIDRYFRDVHRATGWMGTHMAKKAMPGWMGEMMGLWSGGGESLALQTTGAYLAEHVHDPLLRAVLAAQWGDYGLPPAHSAFGIHALVTGSYYDGAFFPVGGARVIAEAFARNLAASGGEVLLNRDVREILVEGGRAVGVRAEVRRGDHVEEEIHRADVVVSDVGALATFLELVPETVELPHRADMRAFRHGYSAVGVYLGLDREPRTLGATGANLWIHSSTDLDHNAAHQGDVLDGRPTWGFLSFPSAKDPAASKPTAEILTFVDHAAFERWSGSEWLERPDDYAAAKARIAEGLIALAEAEVPGLRAAIAHVEVSTPLTLEHFTHHPFGAFYGVPAIPEHYRAPWLEIATPIEGLYLTGTDVASLGIMGAGMGGALSAGKILGTSGLGSVMRTLR